MPDETDRKSTDDNESTPEGVGIKRAQAILGDLVHRAGFDGERTVLTLNGRPTAAVVSMKDLERLRALDAASTVAA